MDGGNITTTNISYGKGPLGQVAWIQGLEFNFCELVQAEEDNIKKQSFMHWMARVGDLQE